MTEKFKRKPVNVDLIDWDKTASELAPELKLSRQRIEQLRPPGRKPLFPNTSVKMIRVYKDQAAGLLKGLTISQISEKYNISRRHAGKFVEPEMLYADTKKYPYHLINFELPNCDIELIWRMSFNTVANYRQHNEVPKAKWNRKHGSIPKAPGYVRTFVAEEEKANAFFVEESLLSLGIDRKNGNN